MPGQRIATVHDSFDFDRNCSPPFEFVAVTPSEPPARPVPEAYRHRIVLHTVHDGGAIPRQYRMAHDGRPLVDPELLERTYVEERDWGANLVAQELAGALGIAGYSRCLVARTLVDFNRFPGSTPPNARDPFDYLAISPPFSDALTHSQKAALLEDYYDRISDLIEKEVLNDRLIVIGVHTYDERNPSLTRRPDVSLVTRPAAYQTKARMPFGVFDPLYPDRLGESTCSRILRDRISLNLERAGFRANHNHPYALPNGSVEVRAQVWFFFQYLRRRFEAAYPQTRDVPPYQLVWTMLLNTNLRLAEAEALRGYLHRFRRVPPDVRAEFERARQAYEHVGEYLMESNAPMHYRRSHDRPSSLALEVRKDLVCSVDSQRRRPEPASAEQRSTASEIGRRIAEAITIYLETDRAEETDQEAQSRRGVA